MSLVSTRATDSRNFERLRKCRNTSISLFLLAGCVLLTSSCSLPAQSASASPVSARSNFSRSGGPGHDFGRRLRISASFPQGTVGAAYNVVISVSGGADPYAFSLASGSLPAGLSLNAATGSVSGTPAAAGIYNFTLQVVDATDRNN